MDLRPLSYEEMCQMELMHAATNAAAPNLNVSGKITASGATSSGATNATATTTMVPIMVIPTSLMPAGTILTATPANVSAASGGDCEHYYQLQPTHILTATPAAAGAGVGGADSGGIAVSGLGTSFAQPLLLQTPTESQAQQLQQQQPPQQIPQTVNVNVNNSGSSHAAVNNPNAATVNILYGTLTKPNVSTATSTTTPLTRQALESATLPRGFQPGSFILPAGTITADESDFEGSECGASVSTTTCIPHFRFGGCGIILQPASMQQHQQHQAQQQHEPQVVGCGALTHMMGSFAAAAAGGAVHSGRLVGTLGRARRSSAHGLAEVGSGGGGGGGSAPGISQTPKRVSFKGDHMPPEELQMEEPSVDVFNNCSYMHFDNFMDYQTTGFGGLPDVTEHSNIRRTLSRQNSISNSDSCGEIASIQKSKVNFVADSKTTTSTTTNNTASAKRKSKAAQHNESHGAQRYKSRRGTCVLGMTLVVALALLAIAATLAYQHFFMSPSRNSHAQRLRIVRRILREVPLVDGHNNFAWNVRKYAHSSLELVHLGHEDDDHKAIWTRPVWAQTDMERLRQGLVGVQVWSAYVPCEAQGLDAVQLALEQIDIIRRLTDMYGQQTALVTTSQDIATAHRHGLMASLIGIEGGHTIGSSLGVLRSFYSLGARYLSLTHKCDVSWAGSSASSIENGLSQFGKAIIREMNRLGMMIDLSYSSDATARDVLQATRAPVIFSHSAARQLCNSTRNIPDDILRLVAENGGLIMISFDSDDVACGRQARLSDVIAHINYIRTIAGVQHIGLGAGYDGIELPPVGLEDVSKYPDLLATLLEDHNWSEEDIAMLAGKNFLRIMETVENVRDYWKRAAIQPIEQTEPQPKTQCTYMSS